MKAFITQISPLGTMDYLLLNRKTPLIDQKYGFALLVPPLMLGIGILTIVLMIAGVAFACYMY